MKFYTLVAAAKLCRGAKGQEVPAALLRYHVRRGNIVSDSVDRNRHGRALRHHFSAATVEAFASRMGWRYVGPP